MEKTEDDLPANSSDTNGNEALDMEIVARSFHVVSDGAVFDDLLDAWYRKLFAQTKKHERKAAAGALRHHYSVLSELLDRSDPPNRLDEIDRLITSIRRPAVIVSRDLRVVAANADGCHLFDVRPGSIVTAREIGHTVTEAITRSRSWRGSFTTSMALTMGDTEKTADQLIEIRPLKTRSGNSPTFLITSVALLWHERVSTILRDSFEMTSAEIDVCQLILEGHDVRRIAEERGTSRGTVRNQLQAILDKSRAGSQVQLVRLLSMISNHVSNEDGSTSEGWSDPYGREQRISRSDGSDVCFSWIGDVGGRPAIMLHGIGCGFLFPETFDATLKNARVKLYVPHRPGCGNARREKSLSFADDYERTIRGLLDHLKCGRVPVMAIHASANLALRMAAGPSNPFSSILAIRGAFIDYEEMASVVTPNRKFRLMRWATRNAPWLAEAILAVGYRQYLAYGAEWFYREALSNQTFDLQTSLRPDIAPLLRSASSLSLAQNGNSIIDEITLRDMFDAAHARNLDIPLKWLVGKENMRQFGGQIGVDWFAEASSQILALNDLIDLVWVDHAADLMPYQAPEFVAKHLAELLGPYVS